MLFSLVVVCSIGLFCQVCAAGSVEELHRDVLHHVSALSSFSPTSAAMNGPCTRADHTLRQAANALTETSDVSSPLWDLDIARARLHALVERGCRGRNGTYAALLYREYQVEESLLVDYTNALRLLSLDSSVKAALGSSASSSSSSFFEFYDTFLIPKIQYEGFFRRMVQDVLALYSGHFSELVLGPRLHIRVVDDLKTTAEAWYNPKYTVIVVNIARPITQEKLQQLVAHEVMHYVQDVVHNRNQKYYDTSSALFSEGSAEYAVDLVFPESTRAMQLHAFYDTTSLADAQHLVAVSAARSAASWAHVVRIAGELHEGTMDDDDAKEQMESKAMLRHDSWPNVGFMKVQGSAYVATYALGKEIIQRFIDAVRRCDDSSSAWVVFVAFTRFTPTPWAAQHRLNDCVWLANWKALQ